MFKLTELHVLLPPCCKKGNGTRSCCTLTLVLFLEFLPPTDFSLSPAEFQLPVTEPDINNRLESLCLSMTEHALGGESSPLALHFRECPALGWDLGKEKGQYRGGRGECDLAGCWYPTKKPVCHPLLLCKLKQRPTMCPS